MCTDDAFFHFIYAHEYDASIRTYKEMRWVQYMMPVFFLFFLNNSPAGLTYYYFVSNMVTFGQQWGIRRFLINDETIHAQIQENKTKPVKNQSLRSD